ncbi:Lar family restriction alleviation protein [Caproicibacterium amylolyticum]|uniref:Lar family restriction alleviation protein n=1 Tax=Caproicibacterium amylolyticum TaxID=2766537 RepID=A0A7G9WJQ7_9FIRM|nr:Lar family restriction alleviation protein [Caproicibacterium amylolyticum]QNO18919.1 Lar family restriction alleviation protein [Caproicibacterium amylolyticum]
MSNKIKMCPFCGAKPEIDYFPDKHCDTYGITCSNEKCIAHSIFEVYCSTEEAIKAWNCRAKQLKGSDNE